MGFLTDGSVLSRNVMLCTGVAMTAIVAICPAAAQGQNAGAVPSGQPQILSQTIRIRIDHSHESLHGDWEVPVCRAVAD